MQRIFNRILLWIVLSVLAGAFAAASALHAAEPAGWIITNKQNGMTHDTRTGKTSINGIEAKGLVGVVNKGGRQLLMYWEPGAANQTIELDGKVLVPGKFEDEAVRLGSIRLSRAGSLAYLQHSKGPKAKVWLVQDGKKIFSWPRRTNVSILGFGKEDVLISRDLKDLDAVELFRFKVGTDGRIDPSVKIPAGRIEGCVLTSLADQQTSLEVELICDETKGRDVFLLDDTGKLEPVSANSDDEFLSASLLRQFDTDKKFGGATGVLSQTGSTDALQFLVATNALLLRGVGEPVAVASDEAGKQSWNQSYRTLALSALYDKTGHPVFAALAGNAMRDTLTADNENLKIAGEHNPGCGWASRIYSEDKSTPLSFFVNQSVIMGSLIRSCKALGNRCDEELSAKIDAATQCLIGHYEQQFDKEVGLYRIAKAVPFRFDGIWAPWNWQASFAVLLHHAAEVSGSREWAERGDEIVDRFLQSVEYTNDGALWRYWPPRYYQGWDKTQKISDNMPAFKPRPVEAYEDLNHAGITLAAICDGELPPKFMEAASIRLDRILDQGVIFPREMDGNGPKSSTYQLANGWDCLQNSRLKEKFSKTLSTANFGQSLLAYANLFDQTAPFKLDLKLSACQSGKCELVKQWEFNSASDYLAHSPFFSIEAASDK